MAGMIRFNVPVGIRYNWISWAVLALFFLIGFFAAWLALDWSASASLGAIVGVLLFGFASQEVVKGLGKGVGNGLEGLGKGVGGGLGKFARYVLPFLIGGAILAIAYLLNPAVFTASVSQIITLAIVCLGCWIIIRPLFRKPKKR